jgi:hypothetical protein
VESAICEKLIATAGRIIAQNARFAIKDYNGRQKTQMRKKGLAARDCVAVSHLNELIFLLIQILVVSYPYVCAIRLTHLCLFVRRLLSAMIETILWATLSQ